MYAALAHARRIGERVRKTWATKLVKEQDAHTKGVEKLKHAMETRQAKYDAKIVKLATQKDAAEVSADKAKSSAGNQGEMTKYIAGLVGEQAVRAKVLRVYMNNMAKIRQKYNKKLGSEWKDRIKSLTKELTAYKNGKEFTRLKYQIMKLKNRLQNTKKKKHIKLELKRAQHLDIQTLLHAAISHAQRGSEQRTGKDNQHRVIAAVNAVVKTVMGADRKKGAQLARRAIRNSKYNKLKSAVAELKMRNKKLQERLAAQQGKPAAEHPGQDSAPTPQRNKNMRQIVKKRKRLWKELHNLVKISKSPEAEANLRTKKKTQVLPQKGSTTMKTQDVGASSPPFVFGGGAESDAKIGELRKGAFLPVERQELAESDEELSNES